MSARYGGGMKQTPVFSGATHAVLVVGYIDGGTLDEHFIIRNSWGQSWGDAGYGYLPYSYVRQLGVLAGLVDPFAPA
jgi:C1A family cysteine protease